MQQKVMKEGSGLNRKKSHIMLDEKVKEMELCVPVKEMMNVEYTVSNAISDVEANMKRYMSLKLSK